MLYRQGELLIRRIDKLPAGLNKQKNRVLAEGEITGHLHELTAGTVFYLSEWRENKLYFTIENKPAQLMHPEHGPQEFIPGNYEVIKQREYIERGFRNILD